MNDWRQWAAEGFFGVCPSLPANNSALIEAFVSGKVLGRLVELHVSIPSLASAHGCTFTECTSLPVKRHVYSVATSVTTLPWNCVQEADIDQQRRESFTHGIARGRADMEAEMKLLEEQGSTSTKDLNDKLQQQRQFAEHLEEKLHQQQLAYQAMERARDEWREKAQQARVEAATAVDAKGRAMRQTSMLETQLQQARTDKQDAFRAARETQAAAANFRETAQAEMRGMQQTISELERRLKQQQPPHEGNSPTQAEGGTSPARAPGVSSVKKR